MSKFDLAKKESSTQPGQGFTKLSEGPDTGAGARIDDGENLDAEGGFEIGSDNYETIETTDRNADAVSDSHTLDSEHSDHSDESPQKPAQ